MKQRHRHALAIISIAIFGFASAIVIDAYFPRRPSRDEALSYVQRVVQWDDGLSILAPRPKRLVLMAPWKQWQIALSVYIQADETACIDFSYVTRRWFSGMVTEKGTGLCYDPALQQSSIQLVSFYAHGYAAGGVVASPEIASILATWRDHTQSAIPVHNGAFLVTRADEVGLISVVGLDGDGRIVEHSLTFDKRINLDEGEMTGSRQIVLAEGVVALAAYSLTAPETQDCIQLTYLTFENLQRAMTGQTYLSGQTICAKGAPVSIGPTASTAVAGTTIAAGRVSAPDGALVVLRWSDWQEQTVIAEEGFYFAQREGTRLTVVGVALPLE